VAAVVPVGTFPTDIALADGSVWVSVNDFGADRERSSVVRVDPSTNEIAAVIPLGSAERVAAGGGAIWVLSRDEGHVVLVRIDPRRNEVAAEIPLGASAFDVAADETGVWTTVDFDGRSGKVIRVSQETNEEVASIPVQGRLRDIVLGEQAVWVADSTSTLDVGPSLVRIDPATNRIAARVHDLAGHDVAVGNGEVWVHGWLSSFEPSVGNGSGDRPVAFRIDTTTNRRIGEPIPLEQFHPFAVGEGGVWFIGDGPVVSRLNLEYLHVDAEIATAPMAVDSTVHAVLDPAGGTIWVANYEDSITRIELR